MLVTSSGWKSLFQHAFVMRNASCKTCLSSRIWLRSSTSINTNFSINKRAIVFSNLGQQQQSSLQSSSLSKHGKAWNTFGQQYRVFGTGSSSSHREDKQTKLKQTKPTMKVVMQQMIQDENLPSPKALVEQALNVPNLITITRIVATPYISYLVIDGSYQTAIGLLIVAAISDWLDGYLARRLNQQTVLGSFLDPFADKMMVGCLSLSLMWQQLLPWQLVALIVGRDAGLIAGTVYHRYTTKARGTDFFDTSEATSFKVEPSLLSKINTAVQFSTFGLALVNAAWQIPGDANMSLLFGLVGVTTVMSGGGYVWDYMFQTGAFHQLKRKFPRMRK